MNITTIMKNSLKSRKKTKGFWEKDVWRGAFPYWEKNNAAPKNKAYWNKKYEKDC